MFVKTMFNGGFTVDADVASITCADKSSHCPHRHMELVYRFAGKPSERRDLLNTTTVYVMGDDGKTIATFAP